MQEFLRFWYRRQRRGGNNERARWKRDQTWPKGESEIRSVCTSFSIKPFAFLSWRYSSFTAVPISLSRFPAFLLSGSHGFALSVSRSCGLSFSRCFLGALVLSQKNLISRAVCVDLDVELSSWMRVHFLPGWSFLTQVLSGVRRDPHSTVILNRDYYRVYHDRVILTNYGVGERTGTNLQKPFSRLAERRSDVAMFLSQDFCFWFTFFGGNTFLHVFCNSRY